MEKEKLSNLNKFVYQLIYPAILGSMLYDALPIKDEGFYSIQILIIVFYLLDYIHLYFFMGRKFSIEQQNGKIYILFDLFVSICLFIGFKYSQHCPILTCFTISIVPVCFLIYSRKLNFRKNFYRTYSILVITSFLLLFYIYKFKKLPFSETHQKFDAPFLYFTLSTVVTYLLFVVYQFQFTDEAKEWKKKENDK